MSKATKFTQLIEAAAICKYYRKDTEICRLTGKRCPHEGVSSKNDCPDYEDR